MNLDKHSSCFRTYKQLPEPCRDTYLKVYDMVLEFFSRDRTKTELWFRTPNDTFKGFSPNDLFEEGHGQSVLDITKTCIQFSRSSAE